MILEVDPSPRGGGTGNLVPVLNFKVSIYAKLK